MRADRTSAEVRTQESAGPSVCACQGRATRGFSCSGAPSTSIVPGSIGFSFEQQAGDTGSYAYSMRIRNIKMIVSAIWMLAALVIAVLTHPTWVAGIAIAAIGVLPPVVLLLWWNEPAQTMSESIRQAQQ
jgi:hypothetical protein